MKRSIFFTFALALVSFLYSAPAQAQINCNASPSPCATITGFMSASNGVPAANFTLTFQPSQMFFVAGTGVNVSLATSCSTSNDGSVVGIANPLTTTNVSTAFTGTLAAGTYFVEYTFYSSSPAAETLPSPEQAIQLTATGEILVPPPASGVPSNATGMKVYIGTTSGAETLQGSTVGLNTFTQSSALVGGSATPATNTSSCKQVANDAGWPTGTGYQVTLTDPSGNVYPGYPMLWQLLGPGTTINISNGLPYYHGVVTYPVPILASPLNHATQSISGPLNLTGFNLVNVARLGIGLSLPGYPLDVVGQINSTGGYSLNGAAPNGHCLVGNGTAYVDGTCLTSLTTFYQTLQANGTSMFQRPTANFTQRFTLTDNGGSNRTDIDLNGTGTGVKAVTASAAGISGDCAKWNPTGDMGDALVPCYSGIDQYASGGGCTTGASSFSTCTSTVSWAVAFADTNYIVTCTGIGPSDGRATLQGVTTINTNSVVVQTATEGSLAVSFSSIHCHGHHN